jgi:transcriptional regulator with XRE-family HTH domain
VETDEESFADWLRRHIDSRGWDQTEFARQLDIRSQTVSSWMRGVEPRARMVPHIARALGFSAETVIRAIAGASVTEAGFHSPRSITAMLTDAVAVAPVPVPLIRVSDARLKAQAPATDYLYLPTAFRTDRRKRYFALVAPDDAMHPEITTGDTLVIDPSARPIVNDIVVIAAAEGISLGRLTDMSGLRFYRQDATGETVTPARASDVLGVVVVTFRMHRR